MKMTLKLLLLLSMCGVAERCRGAQMDADTKSTTEKVAIVCEQNLDDNHFFELVSLANSDELRKYLTSMKKENFDIDMIRETRTIESRPFLTGYFKRYPLDSKAYETALSMANALYKQESDSDKKKSRSAVINILQEFGACKVTIDYQKDIAPALFK